MDFSWNYLAKIHKNCDNNSKGSTFRNSAQKKAAARSQRRSNGTANRRSRAETPCFAMFLPCFHKMSEEIQR